MDIIVLSICIVFFIVVLMGYLMIKGGQEQVPPAATLSESAGLRTEPNSFNNSNKED